MDGRDWRLASWRLPSFFAGVALLWSVAVGVVLCLVPVGSSVGGSSSGQSVEGGERLFALSPSSLWPLALAALICALATWAAVRHHRRPLVAATVLLALFVLLSGFTVGPAYVPAFVLLVVSVVATPRRRQSPEGGPSSFARG